MTTRAQEVQQLERRLRPLRVEDGVYDLTLTDTLRVRLEVPVRWPIVPAWCIVLSDHAGLEDALEQRINARLALAGREGKTLLRTLNAIAAAQAQLLAEARVAHAEAQAVAAVADAIEPASRDPPVRDQATKDEQSRDDGPIPEAVNHFIPVEGDRYAVPWHDNPAADDRSDGGHTSSDSDSSEDESGDNDDDVGRGALSAEAVTRQASRGTAIDCTLTLDKVSLLEPKVLRVSVRCVRCKQPHIDVANVTPRAGAASTRCPQCSATLRVGLRAQVLHAAQDRIGYLDLEGCTVETLGPSAFAPTCENCDRTADVVRGLAPEQAQSWPCRGCHTRLTVGVSAVSFLQISSAAVTGPGARKAKADKQLTGVVRGTPLPDEGRCRHFRKSYRWLRFGCCGRVYACDRCHDALSDHVVDDQARSQICGRCSRESAILAADRPCPHCGRPFYTRRKAGYWEGGKGTRDQRLLNRNDPRKYRKRI